MGKYLGRIQVAGLGVLLVFGLSGCESDSSIRQSYDQRPSGPADTLATTAPAPVNAVPAGFLATDFAPLQRWLGEPFEIEYRNMTPELVFEQDPIADIRYDTRNLPDGAPLFELKSSSMSRREILYRIADFWDLEMSVEALAGEKPSYVLVTGAKVLTETVAPEQEPTGSGL